MRQLIQGALAFQNDPDNGDTWPQYIDQPVDMNDIMRISMI